MPEVNRRHQPEQLPNAPQDLHEELHGAFGQGSLLVEFPFLAALHPKASTLQVQRSTRGQRT